MVRTGLVPVIIQSTRRDPKSGKVSTFNKKVWVNPHKLKELHKKYKNKIKVLSETEVNKPTTVSKLTQQQIEERLSPYLSYLQSYAYKMRKYFPAFNIDDLFQTAVMGAIEAIHKNPKLKPSPELKKKITAFAFKRLKEFVQENAETMGYVLKYQQKLERGHRYEKVADIIPLLNEESEDETERMFGRKLAEIIWNTVSQETEEHPDLPYKVLFYEIANKFLSPLEMTVYKRVKIEGDSLRIVGGELGMSAPGVKKAAERAESKIGKVFAALSKVQTKPLNTSNLREIYQKLQPNISLTEFAVLVNTFSDTDPERLLLQLRAKKIELVNEDNIYFVYFNKSLRSIYDAHSNKFIDLGVINV